jgi:hypothetical protein
MTKRRASKAASPVASPHGDSEPIKSPSSVEKAKDSNVPNSNVATSYVPNSNVPNSNVPNNNAPIKSWQNIHQPDLLSEFPFKPPTPPNVSSNYVFEHPESPPNQNLPPITSLLGAASSNSQQDWEDRQPIVVESPSQQNVQLPSPNYSSRIGDIPIISNGKFPLNRHNETQIRSRYITTSQNSMWTPHNWQA